MAENTVRIHRVLRAPAERIYRAFLDADAMAKWLPPHGFTGKVHHIKAEVGGTYKMSFTNLTTRHSHSFGGEFLELVPNERIRHTDNCSLLRRSADVHHLERTLAGAFATGKRRDGLWHSRTRLLVVGRASHSVTNGL